MTVDGFGALVRKKCARSHRFGAGGIPLGGGRGGGVGEPRTGLIHCEAESPSEGRV